MQLVWLDLRNLSFFTCNLHLYLLFWLIMSSKEVKVMDLLDENFSCLQVLRANAATLVGYSV